MLHVNTTLLVFPCGLFTTKFQILCLLGKSKGLSLKCVIILTHTLNIFYHLGFLLKHNFKIGCICVISYRDHFSLMDQHSRFHIHISYLMPEIKPDAARMWFIKNYKDGEVQYVMSV